MRRPAFLPVMALLAMTAWGSAAPISVSAPWARATPPVATMGAAYLSIESTQADRLLGATTPAAERTEFHVTSQADGLSQMRPVTELAVDPGAALTLTPGGTHIMLIGLKAPLVAGTEIELLLRFAKAGEVPVRVRVLKDAPAAHQHGH